ncbi:HET-domain-containing protein [Fusarium austroafricanum]|uniref:HET-domain-containing protein n=1 Tax=Fusarium austroafricanum TaxID=2364996 RepID=A0A8H4KDW6_9HYPO|nr:HET-domain-containing protein [Fusarium austroafricanum]
MFLQGFVLDTVSQLEFPSQLGHIPPEWPLLADRGPDGRDPPPFYGPACETAFQEAMDDTLDTSMLINHGSSVISDFLKRVQAVIWNRRMMRTGNSWLGLAPKDAQEGDLICILYGCSVPVVLRKVEKSQADLDKELQDEELRKDNIAAYIFKNLAAKACRKRLDKTNDIGNNSLLKDEEKSGKRVASSYPQSDSGTEAKKPHVTSTATDTTHRCATTRSMTANIEDLIHRFANSQAESIKAKDPKLVSVTLADDCRRFIVPASFMVEMGLPKPMIEAGSPNDLYEQHFGMQLPFIESTSCKIHDTAFDSQKKKATVHLTHQIKLFGVEEEYLVENMILLDLDQSGEKIQKIVEFTDVSESKKYMATLQGLAAVPLGK